MANRRTGPPSVKLGHQAPNGVAAGLLALVERGAARRPRVARELRGRVSSLDWVAATAAAPVSVVVAALAADQVGIRPTYVVAGIVAAFASLAGLVLLLRSGEPTDAHADADDAAADAEADVLQPHDRTLADASARVHA